ncbi:homoserine dehydrogenase [Leptospira perolatii]|uniref:Homoserine dehydrogenase n=1 Tax=Leptospira perolatii TaxID=2023191 RepID=A0A2M9ZIC5_9LEPT|nr:homoserine dehydrogenase [Leptospira perolatii]PJZ68332.1 homoserine dehydrogenase [Leptospira perolatii]PJZ71820.1 homoserine dehydrogenase [Leptospira perolatii]
MKTIRVGLIGAGTVGLGVLKILKEEASSLEKELRIRVQVHSICSRSLEKLHSVRKDFPEAIITDDFRTVAGNPDIDVILELVGGVDVAEKILLSSLKAKQTVITANKALLSQKGESIYKLAEENGTEIGFEAAVGGAIPVIRVIRNCLSGDNILGLYGILNGTTNFILSKMEREHLDYGQALVLAQKAGFAEADPSFDVEGIDTAHKISIIGSLAFKEKIPLQSITVEGITKITRLDIQFAAELGYRIKLLGLVRKLDGKVEARVQPVMIPKHHAFASVMDETNAIYYKAAFAGPGLLMGKGAGSLPTASAVVSDLLYYGARRDTQPISEKNRFSAAEISEANQTEARYYLRFNTVDKPGVLAEIAKVLGSNSVSISSVRQNESDSEPVEVVVVTHPCSESSIQTSLARIDSLEIILEPSIAIRLEDKL